MAKKLGVLAIHGMGDPEPNFAAGLFQRLSRRLGAAADDVAFAECYWSPILQEYQDITWQRLLSGARMDNRPIRRWLLNSLGDPANYLSGFFRNDRPVYTNIHERVRDTLATLEAALGAAEHKPLVVLAHSLGSVIISNYLWDEQVMQRRKRSSPRGEGPMPEMGRTPYERAETLTSLITYGSNIPLFLPPREDLVCIRFPADTLPAPYRAVAGWLNIYDPDDVLGYPLRDVWTDRQGTEISDITINAGWWPLSETPFAHNLYHQDEDFIDIVVGQLEKILALVGG